MKDEITELRAPFPTLKPRHGYLALGGVGWWLPGLHQGLHFWLGVGGCYFPYHANSQSFAPYFQATVTFPKTLWLGGIEEGK